MQSGMTNKRDAMLNAVKIHARKFLFDQDYAVPNNDGSPLIRSNFLEQNIHVHGKVPSFSDKQPAL